MRSIRALAGAVAVLAVLAGCGSDEDGVAMQYDAGFARELAELRDKQETKQLKDLVPGNWDTVRIFIGPHTEEWIEREIGQPVPSGGHGFDTEGNILVFKDGERLERLLGTSGRLLGEGEFSAEVTLTGEKGVIQITDPGEVR